MNKLLPKLLGGLIIVTSIISPMSVFGMEADPGQAVLEVSNSTLSEESIVTLIENSDDHGDNFESATELALNADGVGQISSSDDIDFFKFTTDASEGEYILEVSGTGAAYISTYDFDRDCIDGNSFDSENSYTLNTTYQPNKEYYLEIKSDESDVSYTVRVNKWPDDHGYNISSATTLTLNEEVAGKINYINDTDYFKFTADTKGIYSLDCSGAGDAKLLFLDKTEVMLSGSITADEAYSSDLSLNANETYFLYVWSEVSGVPYKVKLSTSTPTPTTTSTPTVTSTPTPTSIVTPTPLLPKGYLDSPKENATISGEYALKGWYLDMNGVSKIEVIVDGIVDGTAIYGISRADVKNVYPAYDNSNSGYRYYLDTTKLENGIHTIVISEIDNNGQRNSLPARTVRVLNSTPVPTSTPTPATTSTPTVTLTPTPTSTMTPTPLLPKGYFESPKENATISGKYTLIGWYLDINGVSKIEVIVDGIVDGTAIYGISRTDVKNVYPAYDNSNSGYRYYLDTTKLENGIHTIVISEIDNNGQRNSLPARTVQVLNTTPVPTATPTPTTTITPTVTSTPTPTSIVTPTPLLPKGYLDSPKENATISGEYALKGWYLDINGVSKIEVIVDGIVDGTAIYGISRADVKNVYPAYDNSNSGYRYYLDTTKLENGIHTIVISEIDNNGQRNSLPARTVQVLNTTPVPTATPTPTTTSTPTVTLTPTPTSTMTPTPLLPKGYFESPKENATISGKYTLIGWYLDINGVSKIEVIVDGIVDGTAIYGISRTDVKNVYPAYDNSNSGYRYYLDTTKLENGIHTIVICEIDNNGQRNSLPARTVRVLNTTTF